MNAPVLVKDSDYKRPLADLGFSVCSLFSKAQISALKDLYQSLNSKDGFSALYPSEAVSSEILKIIAPALENAFEDYEYFISLFEVRRANSETEYRLQQDWNILDEQKYAAHQIWIPLEISYPENGGTFVLPGSDRFFENYRSQSYGISKVPIDESLRPVIADMIIAPGQALVYQSALFHGHYSNHSDKDHVSVIVSIRQKNAPLYYFHKNNQLGQTEMCTINPATFIEALPALVKGELPDLFTERTFTKINAVDNNSINAATLLQKFKETFDEDEISFEPTQLHILKDLELEKKLHRDGYVVFDFLDEQTVEEIREEYINNFNARTSESGRFTVMENSSSENKLQIHHFILDKIKNKLDKYFVDYQTPIASYFTKYAQSSGGLTWHTDASLLLNTHLEPHYGIWCPLIDVSEENGAFCLIEKSHKFSHSVFCNGIEWPYAPYMADFDEKKKVMELKAGQIVFFDLRLIHHATDNKTEEDRICFCVRLTHQKTKYFSFNNKDDRGSIVNVFEEDPDFYLREEWSSDNQKYPLKRKIGEMHNIYSTIDRSKIEAALDAISSDIGVK